MIINDFNNKFESIKTDDYKIENKEGFIYIVIDKVFPDFIKIGRTTDLTKRMSSYNANKPYDTARVYLISKKFSNVLEVEKEILRVLYENIEPTTFRLEWFERKHLQLIEEIIREAESYFD